jgi:hypothetical protein
MLKRALLGTLGAIALAIAAFAAATPFAPSAQAEYICDNCDCKCGRCHSITKGIYCCPCVTSGTNTNNSSQPKLKGFKSKPKPFKFNSAPRAKRRN